MKRYAVCITDDDGGTGEAVFTVKNKTEARARGRLYIRQWQLPNGKIEYIRELAEMVKRPSSLAAPLAIDRRGSSCMVEKLVSVVCDYLDAEADYKKYSLDVRKELGLAPDSPLWIPSLNGSKAYRLGELSEKSGATGSILADICAMLDINQELLVAAVKSMQRKERHNGRWDNPNYTCWMNEDDKKRLARFLSNERGESGVYPWFSSTGRKKPWCE